jgi:hypothetical protein
VTYVDTTVSATGTYSYRVKAVNATGSSAYTNTVANLASPAIPAAPTGFTVKISVTAGLVDLAWSHVGGVNLTDFTIQRASNATFTKGVSSITVAGNLRETTQTVSKGTYYYRIRANGIAGSSAWTNGSPFPIKIP